MQIPEPLAVICEMTHRPANTAQLADDLRYALEEVHHLDLTEETVKAVAAGMVEALAAAGDLGSPARAALAIGWALRDIAVSSSCPDFVPGDWPVAP